jgi:hypothetical protein
MRGAPSKEEAFMDNGQSTNGLPSRREFLTRAGILAGGMAVLGVTGYKPQAFAADAARAFTPGMFFLEVEGQPVPVRSAEGGFPRADVITEPLGPSPFVKKHIGLPKFGEIAVECDPVMPKPLFDWVNSALNMTPTKRNGAIVTADFNRKEQSRLQFNNALISEIGFPSCDGASKDAGYLTVKCAPEFTQPLAGKGTDVPGALGARTKAWLVSNFRLTIPGLDCSRVMKIEAFTIRQKTAQDTLGQSRDFLKEPGKLEFPNLCVYVAEAYAGTFYAWFQDMVLKGNSGEQNERVGTLELLDPTMHGALLTVTFQHLGLFAFAPEKAISSTEAIRRVKVEMYCEQIALALGKGA